MKIRNGFVSNSSSSSFLCLGVESEDLIEALLKAEKLEKNKDGYYDEEGYGSLAGKNIIFYGTSENSFYYAGFNETETKKLLEDNNLKEARILFKKKILNKLHINIDISQIDLFFGESSSD